MKILKWMGVVLFIYCLISLIWWSWECLFLKLEAVPATDNVAFCIVHICLGVIGAMTFGLIVSLEPKP